MLARRWTGAAILRFAPIVGALTPVIGDMILIDPGGLWVKIEDDPMCERASRRVRIVNDQDQTFGVYRDAFDAERGAFVVTIAGILLRNMFSITKCQTADSHIAPWFVRGAWGAAGCTWQPPPAKLTREGNRAS